MTNEEFNQKTESVAEHYDGLVSNLTELKEQSSPHYSKALHHLISLREIAVSAIQEANVSWQKIQRLEKGLEVKNGN